MSSARISQAMSTSTERLERLKKLSTPLISDIFNTKDINLKAQMISGISPLSASPVCGLAYTALYVDKDNEQKELFEENRFMLDFVPRHQSRILIIETRGKMDVASSWGGLLSHFNKRNGILGMITNGHVRDIEAIRALNYPVFSVGANPNNSNTGYKVVSVNHPIQIKGVTINPDDYILADASGIAVIPPAVIDQVLDLAEKKSKDEKLIAKLIDQDLSLRQIQEIMGPSNASTVPDTKAEAASSANVFDSSNTAKPVAAIKAVTTLSSFWQSLGKGTRTHALVSGNYYRPFVSDIDLENARKHRDGLKIFAAGIRERWINKIFHQFVKIEGCKQVIILGSGYDIRPYKKNAANQAHKKNAAVYAEVKYWEIDRAHILNEKERILNEQHHDKNATYIKADYIKDNFLKLLAESDLNFSAKTLIIWEGNWTYLENEEVDQILKKLRLAFNDLTLVFDYCTQTIIDGAVAKRSIWQGKKQGIDNIEAFAEKHGFSVVQNKSTLQLAQDYGVDQVLPEESNQYLLCGMKNL